MGRLNPQSHIPCSVYTGFFWPLSAHPSSGPLSTPRQLVPCPWLLSDLIQCVPKVSEMGNRAVFEVGFALASDQDPVDNTFQTIE